MLKNVLIQCNLSHPYSSLLITNYLNPTLPLCSYGKRKSKPKSDAERKPIIETRISKSKDGKWLIHRTVIVDIKPIAYLKEIIKD